ncbi:hypothetical protein EIP91_000679 [Steccherinum ochraceum]|uniref:Beta-1,4-mannosyl-glycoprotein 4-beta-N-acetylglucosaminyltransferase n=1 Tax=Steccherinum ochraceum TaxID=92696 RepID=A0A4R0RNX5_9APHY|nr:hypothetical protein EIP91_000679 [Steccherinum ochraceum]
MAFPRGPARFLIFFLAAFLVVFFVTYTFNNHYQIRNTLSYATRPLWDKDDAPSDVLVHYHAEGLDAARDAEYVCGLHAWPVRKQRGDLKVLDAVLMSSELDLLEIRMNELDEVVDRFLIVESNATFTGLPKEAYFAKNRAMYSKFEDRIVYRFLPGFALADGESAWDVERRTRDAMSSLIAQTVAGFASGTQSLVIMSDMDEIPSKPTIALLKECDFGQSIHLQLRNYLYSFEWYLGLTSWRASVQLWDPENSFYRHSKSGERILADSGWHCSYCFRTIQEYAVKMKGFSHADRIGGRIDLLAPKRIQDVICKGKDIFGMLPEAYSYKDLLSQMSLDPLKSAVGLPRYLLQNARKFSFLLPGGCERPE